MRISLEQLLETAGTTGFRPEMLEKVIQLMHLLRPLQEHPSLQGKFALKGGTALNLYYFETPRLSVDIDLNYIGYSDVDAMKAERPNFEKTIEAVFLLCKSGFLVCLISSLYMRSLTLNSIVSPWISAVTRLLKLGGLMLLEGEKPLLSWGFMVRRVG